jgi:hypothetical protein
MVPSSSTLSNLLSCSALSPPQARDILSFSDLAPDMLVTKNCVYCQKPMSVDNRSTDNLPAGRWKRKWLLGDQTPSFANEQINAMWKNREYVFLKCAEIAK